MQSQSMFSVFTRVFFSEERAKTNHEPKYAYVQKKLNGKLYKVTMSKNTNMQIQCLRCLLLSSYSVEILKFEHLWNRLKDFGLGFYPWHSSSLPWLLQTFTLMGSFTKLQRNVEAEGDKKNSNCQELYIRRCQEAWWEALQSYNVKLVIRNRLKDFGLGF